jgi:hypothetical protein
MKTNLAPLLSRYQEMESQGTLTVRPSDEVTFIGRIYKSLLLDLKSGADVNRGTSCTKVLNETSDDE